MGEHNVSIQHDEQQAQLFMKALLNDLTALEQMIERGQLESGVRRIGAEQEMFLVDAALRPASVAPAVRADVEATVTAAAKALGAQPALIHTEGFFTQGS